jgi:hypothetical protein
VAQIKFRVKDYSDEISSVNWTVTAGIATPDANTLRTAIAGVIRGTMDSFDVTEITNVDPGSKARPASPEAQREDKWVITYLDNVLQKEFRLSLPTADRSLLAGGSEQLPPGTELTNLETAFNAYVLSPYGNPVTLQSVEYVAVAI